MYNHDIYSEMNIFSTGKIMGKTGICIPDYCIEKIGIPIFPIYIFNPGLYK